MDDPASGIKNGPQTRLLIETAIDNGHKVAVTTYSLFPEVCEPAMKKLGLAADIITQIPCIAYLPQDQSSGKTRHMIDALEAHNLPSDTHPSKLMLIDDSANNCHVAQKTGFLHVKVPDDPSAIDYLDAAIALASIPAKF